MILLEIKKSLLRLLHKSDTVLHEEKVFITPKTGNQTPYWKTVEKGDPKQKKERTKKQDEQSEPRKKKQDDETSHQKKQDIEAIKQTTKRFCEQFKSNEELFEHMKKLGITWKESDKARINTMRAKMALNAAFANGTHGLKMEDYPAPEKTDEPEPKPNTSGPIPEHVKTMTKMFYKTFSSDEDFFNEIKQLGIKWTESDKANVNMLHAKMAVNRAIVNGLDLSKYLPQGQSDKPLPEEEKVPGPLMIKKIAKQAVNDFQKTCKDRDDFFNKLRQMGVKWKECGVPRTDMMRAKMAASHAVKDGLDLFSGDWLEPDIDTTPNPPKTKGAPPPTPISEEAKDMMRSFCTGYNPYSEEHREALFEAFRQAGITWQEHKHRGINLMRAKMEAEIAWVQGLDLMKFKPDWSQIKSPSLGESPNSSSGTTKQKQSSQPTSDTEQKQSSGTTEPTVSQPPPEQKTEPTQKVTEQTSPPEQTSTPEQKTEPTQKVTEQTSTPEQTSSPEQKTEPTIDELEQKVADTEVKAAQAEAKAAQAEVKAAKTQLKTAKKKAKKQNENQISLFDEPTQTTTEQTQTEEQPKSTPKKKKSAKKKQNENQTSLFDEPEYQAEEQKPADKPKKTKSTKKTEKQEKTESEPKQEKIEEEKHSDISDWWDGPEQTQTEEQPKSAPKKKKSSKKQTESQMSEEQKQTKQELLKLDNKSKKPDKKKSSKKQKESGKTESKQGKTESSKPETQKTEPKDKRKESIQKYVDEQLEKEDTEWMENLLEEHPEMLSDSRFKQNPRDVIVEYLMKR